MKQNIYELSMIYKTLFYFCNSSLENVLSKIMKYIKRLNLKHYACNRGIYQELPTLLSRLSPPPPDQRRSFLSRLKPLPP